MYPRTVVYSDLSLIRDRHNLLKGEVYIQHLAVLKKKHERRMECLLKLNNYEKCFYSTRMPPSNRKLMPKGGWG
jgi:hypothetical protein